MNVPVYTKGDLHFAAIDGEYSLINFSNFISELNDNPIDLEDDVEIGIVALADDKGTAELTIRQRAVLQRVVNRYSDIECNICGDTIPLNEVLYLKDDGYCSYHKNLMDRED